jgi:alkaline phosphatase
VVFIHPDGASLNHWNAARLYWAGPDGNLNWDLLPQMAVYRTHMLDSLQATSHGGGTVHAFGVKVKADSYGMNGKEPCTALSGKQQSIMQEARAAGLAIGIVNSGSLIEPGTGVFLAGVPARKMYREIVTQVLSSGAEVIMGGGEEWLLPAGVKGRHGDGARDDGRNLIDEAKQAGYTIVFTREELNKLAPNTTKLLGVFAHGHTFHDGAEETLREQELPSPLTAEEQRLSRANGPAHPTFCAQITVVNPRMTFLTIRAARRLAES